jgi:hypothetical protein
MHDIDIAEEYRLLGAFHEEAGALIEGWPDGALFGVHPEVSGWSVAQHLYHVFKSNGSMMKAIQFIRRGSPPVTTEGGLNEAGAYVMARGRMARGVAQAPDRVLPLDAPGRGELRDSLERSRTRYDEVASLLPDLPSYPGRLPHPFLGLLNAAEWLRTARIHSDHHLAIAREVAAVEGHG